MREHEATQNMSRSLPQTASGAVKAFVQVYKKGDEKENTAYSE